MNHRVAELHKSSPPALKITTLGTLHIYRNGQLCSFPTRKSAALLVYLAVESGIHDRDSLAMLLWPDSPPPQSRTVLRQTLTVLRKTLDPPDKTNELSYLSTNRLTIALSSTVPVQVDLAYIQDAWNMLHTFMERLTHWQNQRYTIISADVYTKLVPLLHNAVDVYQDHFLRHFSLSDGSEFDVWISQQQQKWHEQIDTILDWLSLIQLECYGLHDAMQTAQKWITLSPHSDVAHQRYADIALQIDDRTALKQQLRRTTQRDTIPQGKSEHTTHIIVPYQDTYTPGYAPFIPEPSTAFIGREADCNTIHTLLDNPQVRIITVVGPPGVGKTRLVLAVANTHQRIATMSCLFVDLSTITHPDIVPSTIAQALNISLRGQQQPLTQLQTHIGDQQILLILDNFEQVLPAKSVLTGLMESCPHVTLLVTSREALHIAGEHQYSLHPLGLSPSPHIHDVTTISQSSAVQLLLQRIQSCQPHFHLTDSNAHLINQLCYQLDGLPLAIELIATHTTYLSLNTILSRLKQHQPLPTPLLRDLPARHQSIHKAIETSYATLSYLEQKVFRQLAICVGGWTLRSAQEILEVYTEENTIRDVLRSLEQKNLVQRQDHPSQTPRFRMLSTIREYALHHVYANNELTTVRNNYITYFFSLTQHGETGLRGADQQSWLAIYDTEVDNLRAVLEWTVICDDHARGLDICIHLHYFWYLRGYFCEAISWMDRFLQHAHLTDERRSKALNTLGNLALSQTNYTYADTCYSEALVLRRELQYQAGIASTLNNLGLSATYQGHFDAAIPLLQESLHILRDLDRAEEIAGGLNNLGLAYMGRNEYDQGITLLKEALDIWRSLGQTWGIASILADLGVAATYTHQYDTALRYVHEGLQCVNQLNYAQGMARYLEVLALIKYKQTYSTQTAQLFSMAHVIRETLQVPWNLNEHQWFDSTRIAIETTLGPSFATAWQEGQALMKNFRHTTELSAFIDTVLTQFKVPLSET
ncbi:MAG: tetratricopeptide repeat protein [Chloroflexota bacterium]